ncbi:MAG: ABC transporter ATP-binding protein [Lachnospiraceae bacterium]|nr:ABC transporter ATP-binding protein [Lachnospiraceae bacterium]
MNELLEIRQLNGFYKKKQVLTGIDLSIAPGEIVGLVGESGSGKSSLAKAILHAGIRTEGEIRLTGKAQMIFQDTYHSLNPAMTVGRIMEEPLLIEGRLTKEERKQRVRDMMGHVELDLTLKDRYPSELSGGQRQRVCIGTALLNDPKLLIADEPVSALDVTVQAKVLQLLDRLNAQDGITLLFISHDLRVVYELCNRILIMKDGRIIEQGSDEEVFMHPKEPYTKKLLSAIM